MTETTLDSLLQAADWDAVEVAEQQGPAALTVVEPYLAAEDRLVRLLAVDCIVAAGGPRAAELLVRALRDPDGQVREHAINGLHRHVPEGLNDALLAVLDESDAWYIRQQIPLVLGRSADQSIRPALQARYAAESNDEVRLGYLAALARLGDPEAQDAFANRVATARGEGVHRLMPFVQYIDEPWLIPSFLPLLERKELAVDQSIHIMTIQRRTCDLAVEAVMDLSGHAFSFAKDPLAQYTDAQIAEVVRYVQDYIEAQR